MCVIYCNGCIVSFESFNVSSLFPDFLLARPCRQIFKQSVCFGVFFSVCYSKLASSSKYEHMSNVDVVKRWFELSLFAVCMLKCIWIASVFVFAFIREIKLRTEYSSPGKAIIYALYMRSAIWNFSNAYEKPKKKSRSESTENLITSTKYLTKNKRA